MGWIRALKGHNQKLDELKFKEGDELALSLECQTTDKVVLMASGGRAFTLGADKLPGGRGHGEPIRLNLEVPEAETHRRRCSCPRRRAGASSPLPRAMASSCRTPNSSRPPARARSSSMSATRRWPSAAKVEGDMTASIGKNRKMVIFKTDELPEMARGKGVKIQSFKDGGLIDIKTFAKAEGLSWID